MIAPYLEPAAKAAGIEITAVALHAFEVYAAELIKWNRRYNLTAIRNAEDVAIKHFVDSLYLVRHVNAGEEVLDIGSGAGFPAIPLKIMCPDIRVVSVDAVNKKIMFQKHVARLLGLIGFDAVHARVEDLQPTMAAAFDLVTSRAFSRVDVFAALAGPFLKADGRLIAMKGPEVHAEIGLVEAELQSTGFFVVQVSEYELPLHKGKRSLLTMAPCKCP